MKNHKVGKILFAETLNKYYYSYQNWYLPLKKYCNELIDFDTRLNYFKYGKEEMNRRFLGYIKREQPDYVIFFVRNDEFYLSTLLKIREISPKTITFIILGDDDAAFENFSRYFILFLDYGLVGQHKYLKEYKKDGLNKVFFSIGFNSDFFKPMQLKKEYDVTFVGHPKPTKSERYETLKFLKDNGINVSLFGWGWDNYPELKEIYKGALDSEKLVEVINKSKINLCFSKNHFGVPHITAKLFEGDACKAFVLTEYCDEYPSLFKEGKEIIMYKDKEDLLKKIKYYLKHEEERERIANAAYKKVINKYDVNTDLERFFKRNEKGIKHKPLPEISKKIISLSKLDFQASLDEIKKNVQGYDYVYFKTNNSENLEYREYIQAYSLEKTKKEISCCNYYVYSKLLGDYLYFGVDIAYNFLGKKDFDFFINIDQIMVTKKYFMENIAQFKELMEGRQISFVNRENTAFISLPLVRIYNIKSKDYETMKKAFSFHFLFQLLSLKMQKKFFTLYPIALLLKGISGNKFILRAVINTIKDKDKQKKLDNLQKT